MTEPRYDEAFRVTYPCAAKPISFTFMNRDDRDFIARQVREGGIASYEKPTPGLIISLSQVETPGTFLDIGANTGIFALLAAAASECLEVYAFEPLPHIRRILERNLDLNPSQARRIHPQAVALSNRTGSFEFFETVNDHGFIATSSSLEIAHVRDVDRGEFLSTEVDVLTLDAWLDAHPDIPPVRLIKIDVETHEYAVIEGARGMIRRHRPMTILEVLPNANTGPIQDMVEQEGYLAFALTEDAFLQCFRLGYTELGSNVLLCPRERIEQIFWLARQHDLRIGLL